MASSGRGRGEQARAGEHGVCEALAGHAYRIRGPGSIAVSACYVAAGRFDGMFSTRDCRSVDAAAAQLVVREAGGVLSFGGELADAPLAWTPATGSPPPAPRLTWTPPARGRPVRSEPRTPEGDPHGRLGAGRAAGARPGGRRSPLGWHRGRAARRVRARARLVRRYTGLRPRGGCPRPSWSAATSGPGRTSPPSARCRARSSERWPSACEESGSAGGIGQSIARAATGLEVGLTLGYLAQKVVGQYDVALDRARPASRGCCSWRPTCPRPTSAWRWTASSSSAGSPCTRRRTRCSSPRCLG